MAAQRPRDAAVVMKTTPQLVTVSRLKLINARQGQKRPPKYLVYYPYVVRAYVISRDIAENSSIQHGVCSLTILHLVACRTGGYAGPARYKRARAKRENEREAQGKKYPPVSTPLFMLFQPFAWRTVFADWLLWRTAFADWLLYIT